MGEVADLDTARARAESQRLRLPLASGGGPPHDSGMEARVAVLEEIAKSTKELLGQMRADVSATRSDIAGLRADVSLLRGKVENLPTSWQMVTAVIGGNIALAGILMGAIKLFGH